MKKLNHYSIEEVIDTYQIKRHFSSPSLSTWLTITPKMLSPFEEATLVGLPALLLEWQYAWNEEELKMYFISPLIRLACLNEPGVLAAYFDRKLKGVVEDTHVSVVVDCFVATPKMSGNPDIPYFFLQEFKRSKGDSHDPEGQMLAAMILAQALNQDGKPLYGSWVQGRFWYFTTLLKKDYSVSKPFDATNPNDLLQIVFILRKLKELILGTPNPFAPNA